MNNLLELFNQDERHQLSTLHGELFLYCLKHSKSSADATKLFNNVSNITLTLDQGWALMVLMNREELTK